MHDNPAYYEQHADDVELWSPGNPTFPPSAIGPEAPKWRRWSELLQRRVKGYAFDLMIGFWPGALSDAVPRPSSRLIVYVHSMGPVTEEAGRSVGASSRIRNS